MCDSLPGCSCPTCSLQSMGYVQVKPVAMPAKVELKGLLPLIEKLKGNPDKLECLGLELQMTIDRYAEEVEEEAKMFAETSPHLSQPDEDCI